MAFAHIQGVTGDAAPTASNTLSSHVGSAVGSGNTVVGFVAWSTNSGTPGTPTIADNKSNTYTVKDTTVGGLGSQTSFILGNITNGPTTLTATWAASSTVNASIVWDEYSGAFAASDPTDGSAHKAVNQFQPGVGTNAITTGNVTTTTNGDLIWGGCTDDATGGVTLSAGTGFTVRTIDTTAPGGPTGQASSATEDQVQATAGAIAVTFTDATNGGTDEYLTSFIAIKPVVAAVTAVGSTLMLMGVG